MGHLDAKDGRHGRLERGTKLELVEADKAARGVHDAVVVVHGEHQPARKGVAIDPRDGGHGIAQQAPVQRPQGVDPEPLVPDARGVREVQAVGVEFGNGRGGDDAAGGEARELDEVEGDEEGAAAGGGEAVVWRREDADEVDLWGGLGDGDGPAGVTFTCRNGHAEEHLGRGGGGCHGGGIFLWGGGAFKRDAVIDEK